MQMKHANRYEHACLIIAKLEPKQTNMPKDLGNLARQKAADTKQAHRHKDWPDAPQHRQDKHSPTRHQALAQNSENASRSSPNTG